MLQAIGYLEQFFGADKQLIDISAGDAEEFRLFSLEHVGENTSRRHCVNLRTQLSRIIGKAGLKPWPKLFHNLRATRETELAAEFPLHVVCEWIGNSQPVAARHYLRVTENDFKKAVQIPVQQPAESPRTDSQPVLAEVSRTTEMPGVASLCEAVLCTSVPPRGRTYHGNPRKYSHF